MKKPTSINLQLIAVILLFGLNAQAQLNLGVRAGVNFAKFGPYNAVDFKSRIGGNYALVVNIPVTPILNLQFEPGFSQRGAKIDISNEGNSEGVLVRSDAFGKLSLSYVELPLLFQYRPKIGKFEGILSLGPELRVRVGKALSKVTYRNYQDGLLIFDELIEADLNSNNNINDFDYGLAGGAGLAYKMQTVKIFTEVRYHLGLKKVYKDGVDPHNRGASILAGLMVPIGK